MLVVVVEGIKAHVGSLFLFFVPLCLPPSLPCVHECPTIQFQHTSSHTQSPLSPHAVTCLNRHTGNMARNSFSHLIELAQIADIAHALPTMVELGWTQPDVLAGNRAQWHRLQLTPEETQSLDASLGMWSTRYQLTSSHKKRRDMPAMKPQGSGNLSLALDSAAPNQRESTLAHFHEEVYARSNSDTLQSRLKTWQKIAAAWDIPPWPIDVDTVHKIGSSLKAGGYKSCKLYFSAALKHHTLSFGEPSAAVRIAVRDATRSIERGLGTSQLKDSFMVEDLRKVYNMEEFCLYDKAFFMTLAGCWFMTREIELTAAEHRHIRFDKKAKTVSWTLPMSKTDPGGHMIERSHICACQGTREPLCPYHALLDWTDQHDLADGASPLFPNDKGQVMSKEESIGLIRKTLAAADIPLTRLGQSGKQEHRYHGHCLRVSGAQFMARHQIPLHTILLLGRWASRAVERYVQEAALTVHAQPLAHPAPCTPAPIPVASETPAKRKRTTSPPVALQQVQSQITDLAEKVSKINIPPPYIQGRKVHLADPREMMAPPAEWATRCGWRYGLVRFLRVQEKDPACQKCFPPQEGTAQSDSSETGEEESSSSSSTED